MARKKKTKRRTTVGPVSKTKASGGKKFTAQTKADDKLGRRKYDQNENLRGDVNATMKKGGSRYDLAPNKKPKIKAPTKPRVKKKAKKRATKKK